MFYTAYFGGHDAKALAQAHGVARVLLKPSENDEILRQVRRGARLAQRAAGAVAADLDHEHLRVMVDQLLEKTGALEAQQRRIERLNRTLEVLSAVNALIVRAAERQALLDEACRIAVEKGGFSLAAIGLADALGRAIRQVAAAGEGSAERDFERLKLGTRSLIWNDAQSGSFVALPLLAGGETAASCCSTRAAATSSTRRKCACCTSSPATSPSRCAISRRRRAWITSPTTTRSPTCRTAACSPTAWPRR